MTASRVGTSPVWTNEAELVQLAEFLHEEIVKVAILGPVPLSTGERSNYQPFIDAMLQYWSSGDVSGVVVTYVGALHALEALLAGRAGARE